MNIILDVGYLLHQVVSHEFSRCYDEDDICLWTTNASLLSQSDAEAACHQRHNSFLARIINSDINNKIIQFRSAVLKTFEGNIERTDGFWIGVRAVDVNDFHWIDGSRFTGISSSSLSYAQQVTQYTF